MNSLSDGHGPQGKESTRRRRRRTRRKGRKDSAGTSPQPIDASAPTASTRSESGLNNSNRSRHKEGSGAQTGNVHTSVPVDVPCENPHEASAHAAFGHSTPSRTLDNKSQKPHSSASSTKSRSRGKWHNNNARPHQGRHNHQHLYAALDLGTNNCRLLVALPQEPGRFRVIDGFSRVVRLGEGLSQTGNLGKDAMDRAVDALKVCAGKLANKNIRQQRLIATEACRQAGNGTEFLERVKTETGLDLEVVNRETEARLAAEGCGSLMDRKSEGAVLFDIGGGSSELILIDSTGHGKKRIADKIAAWTSLPMGVVTLAERFGGKEVSAELYGEMVLHVREHIDSFEGRNTLEKIWSRGRVHLLGTSGTVTTLAGIHLELPKYDRRKVDGIWLSDQQVDEVISSLLSMTFEKRASNPCIGRERADLVLAGCAILDAIRQTWPTNRLRVADRGLREGLLAEMMNKDGAWIRNRKNRWRKNRRPHKPSHQANNNATTDTRNE